MTIRESFHKFGESKEKVMKKKKLFVLSNKAIEKLQMIATRSNLSYSQTVEALIMLADEQNLKLSITAKTQYEVIKEVDVHSLILVPSEDI